MREAAGRWRGTEEGEKGEEGRQAGGTAGLNWKGRNRTELHVESREKERGREKIERPRPSAISAADWQQPGGKLNMNMSEWAGSCVVVSNSSRYPYQTHTHTFGKITLLHANCAVPPVIAYLSGALLKVSTNNISRQKGKRWKFVWDDWCTIRNSHSIRYVQSFNHTCLLIYNPLNESHTHSAFSFDLCRPTRESWLPLILLRE